MKFWKKTCCAILTICLLAASLAGCTAPGGTSSEEDVLQKAIGVPKDTVMMKVNGTDITAEVFCHWVGSSINYLIQQQYSDGTIVWTDSVEEVPVPEYIKNDAAETVLLYQVVEENAVKNGCSLTEEDQKELEEYRTYYIQYMGGGDEATYLEELRLQGISEKTFLHFAEVGFLYEKLYEKLYGEDSGNAPTTEDLQAYAAQYVKDQGYTDLADFLNQTGYLYAKHILISTQDEEGNALPEEKKTEKKQQAEELLAQLKASETPIALFDDLMNQYSEDPGLAQNPDGYLFTSGEMVEAFESAVKSLDENEISGLVESEFGYHIILRRPNTEMFRNGWGQEQFTHQLETWIGEADVEYTDAFDKLDVQAFYEAMQKIYSDAHPQETEGTDDVSGGGTTPGTEETTEPTETAESGEPTGTTESTAPGVTADVQQTGEPSAVPEGAEG
jgi:parvulin-like peptidyl-prolyl isomerase